MTIALRKFKRIRGEQGHDYLLSARNGKHLTKPALGKVLHRVTEEILGKAFGSRIIRILAARSQEAALKETAKLSNAMLHSGDKQTRLYAKK